MISKVDQEREILHDWHYKAHEAFDSWWQGKNIPRNSAYVWLQLKMGLSSGETHIKKMTIEQCQEVIRLIKEDDESQRES
jgi:hypothetical protein